MSETLHLRLRAPYFYPTCFAFIRWALKNHQGRCPLKVDWFAARGLETESPVVIHELREGRKVPLSDHDAIGIDLVLVLVLVLVV